MLENNSKIIFLQRFYFLVLVSLETQSFKVCTFHKLHFWLQKSLLFDFFVNNFLKLDLIEVWG